MTRLSPAVGVTTLLAGAAALLLVGGGGNPDDTGGGVLSDADRAALHPAPVARGAPPSRPDPGVDLTDPAAVASAYVSEGYSLRDTDAGHTNLRAAPYAEPGSPPATVGVLVLDPPAPGGHSSAEVTDVAQVSGEPTGTRRGYLVGYRLTGQGGSGQGGGDRGAAPAGDHARFLVLARQLDGRWLVAGDSAQAPLGEQ